MAHETQAPRNSSLPAKFGIACSQNGMDRIDMTEVKEFCIHEVFSQRVLENPDSEAICGWDGKLSYGELDTLSSGVALHLMSLGVGAEVLVPLCFEKSAWAIVAMMAVLKAGGAFVPLDPSHPVRRLEDIVHQTGATLIIASPQYTDLCKPLVRQVLTLGSSTFDRTPIPNNKSPSLSQPRSVAYVIFTSGSTGQPKGVVIEHRAFCACAIAHGPAHRIGPTSRVLQFASYSFDASLVEILTTLMSGGCCCVPSATDRVNDLALAMNELRVDLAILTPTVASLLVPNTVPLLKTLVMVGEPMQKSQIRDWSHIPHLLCAYGPTEAAVSAIVNPRVTEEAGHLNLGAPVGCRVWIVNQDDHNQLLLVGEIGEALIEGPNLARGYLNDRERTNAAFIESTAWGTAGQRFYKTGDLMRLNVDGTLDFIGRKDMQIKVRGQRVEIGEIEQCLSAEDQVSQTAVLWPNHGPYAHRLVGIVSLKASSNTTVDIKDPRLLQGTEMMNALDCLSGLMDRAEATLPPFMVPSIILPVESIPLLLSGKVNRAKLTELVEDLDERTLSEMQMIRGAKEEAIAADTKLELSMSRVWGEVLNIPPEQISIDKSFLAFGGDSISAMQVVANCRAQGIKTTVQDILRWKTIARILPHVFVGINFAPVTDEPIERPFNLSPIQQMFFEAAPSGESHFNQSFLLRAKRDIRPEKMQRALEAVIKRHSMLRARFEIGSNGKWTQRVTNDISGSYRFQLHDAVPFDEIQPILDMKQETLNILNGPIFVCDLFHAKQESFISVIAHHAVVDLVSWRIILRDLDQILTSGDMLSDVPVSFQTWCALQTQYIQENIVPEDTFADTQQNFAFWEMDNQPNLYGDIHEETFELNKEMTTSLLNIDDCHKALRTEPVDLFLSALCYSFRQAFSEHENPSIYLEGHGRQAWDSNIDLSQTVGWFTTLYPLCIPLSDTNTMVDAVRLTKDLRRAVPENGWTYFASRYLNSKGGNVLGSDGHMEFVFNYSGLYQQLERSDSLLEQVGPTRESAARSMPRFSLFEITTSVERGHLRFAFEYNRQMAHQERIREWIGSTKQCLIRMVEVLQHLPIQYTLSDFPQVSLTYKSLDRVVSQLLPELGLPATVKVEDLYPCAPLQQGILMSQAKGLASYNTHTMWEVEPGPGIAAVDVAKLREAWKKVVLRHPCLRTIFVENITAEKSFHQAVLEGVEVTIAMRKWDSSALELHHPRTESGGGPQLLHQFTIYEADEGRVFCSLNISHAIMDGLSIDNIVRDMLLAYDDRLQSAPGSSYSDYVLHLRDNTDIESLEFWKTRFADIEPCLFPRLEMDSQVKREVQSIRSMVSVDEAKRLWEYCDEGNITMSTLFQLAWALVLQSYVGTDDICFGYLVSGRDIPIYGIQDAVGAFANMLACRVDLLKTRSVSSVLEDMQLRAVQNLEHQFCSLAEVHNALGVSGFFNTILSFQRHEVAKVAIQSSIEFEKREEYDPSEYDLAVGAHVFDRKIFLKIDFQSDVLSRGHAEHIMDTLKAVLISLVDKDVQDIGSISRVGNHGQNTLLALAVPELEISSDSIHSALKYRVEKCPEAVAIEAWDISLSYSELYQLSRLTAQELRSHGVGPQSIVPLCFERSGWTAVAMFAVMIAGGAFVLLDPSHPRIRLEEIIHQVSPILIISSSQQTRLASSLVKTVYTIGRDAAKKAQGPIEDLAPSRVNSSDTAFVIFTSGSTGKPKGVVIEHGAFVSAARAHSGPLEITESSRVLQFASYSFDACLLEILTTLISGGTVCMPSESDRSSNLLGAMRNFRITWANLTPLVADLLLNEHLTSLQTLVVAGEAMTNDQIRSWAGRSTRLINGYGPTEASVAATLNLHATISVPSNIGRPVGCRIWVMDDRHHLVPIGALGELIIDGPTLARGYLHDPEKTAASFVTPPSWLETRYSYVYKTGDLVRYNLDGSISFVRRKDESQVKIRGQRVELSEVEDQLRSLLPGRGQVAVEFRKNPDGRGKLTAFIVLPGKELDGGILEMTEETRRLLIDIKKSLMLSLPKYMVPDMYVPLAKMPLRWSGKLDHGYLCELVNSLSQQQRELYSLTDQVAQDVEPGTEMEKRLQKLWCALLGCEPDGIKSQSNFFNIGGDSILAMKLTANAHKEDLSLPVSAVFQNPTLQSMASYLDASGSLNVISESMIAPFSLLRGVNGSTDAIRASVASLCGISPDHVQDTYPCTPLQEGLIALSMKQPGSYIAQYVLRLPAGLDVERFKLSWEEAVALTEVFRTRIVVYDSTMLQVVVHEKINWQHSFAEKVSTIGALDMQSTQLGMPLHRFELVDAQNETVFRLTAHHALYDGWSLLLLFKQVEDIYNGRPRQKLTAFNRFIDHLTNRSPNSGEYWREQFLGADIHYFPEPISDGYICAGHESITRTLNPLETTRTAITLSTILRAAWAIVIARLTSSNDVLFGAVLSGRNVPILGTEHIVGPTITTVPVRVKLDPSLPVSGLLEYLQKHATDMIPHEHTGLHAIKAFGETEDVGALTSVLVVQSKDVDVSSFKCIGSEVVSVTNTNFDSYPLVLEYKPGRNGADSLCARYDGQKIPSAQMKTVLEDFEFVLQQISSKTSTKVGELTIVEAKESKFRTTRANADTCSRKSKLEMIWTRPKSQMSPLSYKALHSEPSNSVRRHIPVTASEKQLQEFWSHVLGISTMRIGLEDNFFRLGGDSITAIKLTAVARARNINLPVAKIFENPVLGTMAKLIESLNTDVEVIVPFSLLDLSDSDALKSTAHQCGIAIDHIEDIYPCTPLQEGLMALSTKQPGAYIAQHIFRLPNSVDLNLFREAWETVSLLHNILRTRIVLQGSAMLQVVVKDATKFELYSMHNLNDFLGETTLQTRFGAQLTRFIIAEVDKGERYFVLLLHHATFDAWSLPRLFTDVSRFYERAAIRRPVQYNTFINYILKANTEPSVAFWGAYLRGLDTSHFPQLSSPSYVPAETRSIERVISISRPTTSQITTSTLLRAAWAMTLGHYSNCEDVVFCTTLSGRNAELQGIMDITGPTITTVPIRVDLMTDQTVEDFLRKIQSQASAMIPFEQYGLQNIRRISNDAMNACDAPNLLVIQSEESKDNILLGLDTVATPVPNTSSYPLAIECKIGKGCVNVFGYYDESVIHPSQMHRILCHFEHILRQLNVESSDQIEKLSKLSLYDFEVLQIWNKDVPEVIERCIHEITHDRATEAPDAPAVWAWDITWSHGELDRLSSCLAYDLIQAGVKSEVIVPVCFERSGWMVVAMLGILKAGGAFLPWDPTHPAERRKAMILQTGSNLIVTSKQQATLCSGLVKTIFVVDPASLEGRHEKFEPHSDAHSAAYVIYTSGSTGNPKGVVIEHQSYTTSAVAHGPVHHIDSKSRVSQFASYSVDAICLEILTTIMMGGCTCICSDSRRSNGLSVALSEMGVTVSALTPSVLSLLSPEELPKLETVIMVGESASSALVETWEGHVDLINGYGPTETSLSAVMNESMTSDTQSNIGHAVGCVTWIVDMHNHEQLVPIGCIGELLIEGPTLARGYLNDNAKTAEAFVTNPRWLGKPGTRLYKTGDLVRYDPDGTIVFIGRKDMQVKINGHRIELGEIEHHIRRNFPLAEQTAVEMITSDESRVLVAIIIIRDTLKFDLHPAEVYAITAILRSQLEAVERSIKSALPAYMIPSLWIPMAEMPIASSGKIDRKRLREVATGIYNTQRSHYSLSDGPKRQPTGAGLVLQKMWAVVLNLPFEEIGVDDSFFRIGGDSISAMKLAGYASKQGFELPVASIFQAPVLGNMAKILVLRKEFLQDSHSPYSALGAVEIGSLLEEIRPQLSDPECLVEDVMPSTDFQAWAISYGIMNAGFITYMSLAPSKELDADRLERACREVVASHPILRTTFVFSRSQILQVVLKDPPHHFERVECIEGIEFGWSQWLQSQKPLQKGENIVKFVLLRHSSEQRLIMRISHAQYDGISFPLIWDCLSRAYAGRDTAISRPFSTFINSIPDKADARVYWKGLLANSRMTSITGALRPSYSRPLDQTVDLIIGLPIAHPAYTLATLIKAAWSLLLSHIANESDIVFGTLVSGRNNLSLDSVVGPCINIVPLRVCLDSSWKVLNLLHNIQGQQLTSMPFETLGFGDIIKSTDWPSWTRFSSVVQHQNIPELERTVVMDGVACETSAYRIAIDTSDIVILSMPFQGKLKLELGFSEQTVSHPEAKLWLECLSWLVTELPRKLDVEVTNISMAHFSGLKQLDDLVDYSPASTAMSVSTGSSPPSSIFSTRNLNTLESKLQSLWREVLGTDSVTAGLDFFPLTSFFSLSGADLISACTLAHRLQQEGYNVTTKDILDNDTLEGQAALIMSKEGLGEAGG